MNFWQYLRFETFAQKLGNRPLLVAVALFFLGLHLSYGVINFVLATNGTKIPPLGPRQAALFLGGIVLGTWLVLFRRTTSVNRSLRAKFFKKYKEAHARNDVFAQAEIRQIVQQLGAKGHVLEKFGAVLRHAPEPFLALIYILCVANVLRFFAFKYLDRAPETFSGKVLFPNCPWVLTVLVMVGLIIIDMWAVDVLEENLRARVIGDMPGLAADFSEFKKQLTPTELRVFELRVLENRSHKEIWQELNISVPTVKSHINHYNKKWRTFRADKKLPFSLDEIAKSSEKK